MTERASIQLRDVEQLIAAQAPDLVETLRAFLEQSDYQTFDEALVRAPDFISPDALRGQLAQATRAYDKSERSSKAREAWQSYLTQSPERVAPRFLLADAIERAYLQNTAASRLVVHEIARRAPLVYGVWGGLKRVYKHAERAEDAETLGVLTARFDLASPGDVQRGTLIYMQRRARRFLRLLGKAAPEIYPQFAVEVLRAYPYGTNAWDAQAYTQISAHPAKKWGAPTLPKKGAKFRAAYLEAWKRSADPLLLLLEVAEADFAASFAILGLRELFPEALRTLAPTLLARLALRKLPSVHELVVDVLEASPEFHQGKLKALGLHDAVLSLLLSGSPRACTYAIEYARAHAADLPTARWIELLEHERTHAATAKLAAQVLEGRGARALGLEVLGRLVAFKTTQAWAKKALDEEIDIKEISEGFLIEMLYASSERAVWAKSFIDRKLGAKSRPLSFWTQLIDDPRHKQDALTAVWAFQQMRKHVPLHLVPGDWLLEKLERRDVSPGIADWLSKAETLPAGIDLERIKGLVFQRQYRSVAFALLGNQKLIKPSEIGLGWLLALARRADPQLHEWAHRYLLQHTRPEHFAAGDADVERGVARVFELALGAKEPDAVRAFAQTYLLCHHPRLSRAQAEAKQFSIKPAIDRTAYTLDRVWPALFDARSDVRRFAVTLTRVELRRWGAQTRVYELAESSAKEVRTIAYDALAQAGARNADPDLALLPEELDAAQIFSMTESRSRSSRDVAIELIRKHYARIGGKERLGWLMQSADREVRFFAVRLLWEKHRPRGVPSEWAPRGLARETKLRKPEDAGPFDDAEALRDLLRRLLMTIPPGRSMEQLEGARTKKLSASAAKRNLVELVRDLGVADAAFAALVAPVLEEQTGSYAKGEWQACLAALVTLRSTHASLAVTEAAS